MSIFKIKRPELSQIMLIEAAKEGWSYSLEDVDFYFENKRNSIYAIFVNEELAGCVIIHNSLSKVRRKNVYSVGLFIVVRKYRGQGIVGPHLWRHTVTNNLEQGAFVYFHSVERAVDFYKYLGFTQTKLANLVYILRVNDISFDLLDNLYEQAMASEIRDIFPDDIERYNNLFFKGESGLGNCEFVRAWMQRPDAKVLGYYDNGVLKGYGILTICKKKKIDSNEQLAFRVSPLYADNNAIACSLLRALVYFALTSKSADHIELYCIKEPNNEFIDLLFRIGFIKAGKNWIMSNIEDKEISNSKVLNKVFCTIPMEYSPEFISGLRG